MTANELAEMLCKIRGRRTQQQFGRRVGVDFQKIGRWERGEGLATAAAFLTALEGDGWTFTLRNDSDREVPVTWRRRVFASSVWKVAPNSGNANNHD